jgi:hypothetical protein
MIKGGPDIPAFDDGCVGAGSWPDLRRHALGAKNAAIMFTSLCPFK